MTQISPQLVTMALEQCETTAFEKYAQTVFCAVLGPQFKPLGGHKDGGADGFIDSDIHEEVSKATTFFQASKEIDSGNKIRKTIERLIEVGRQPKTLYYATSRQVRHIDRLQVSLSEQLDSNIRIYDAQFFVQHANYNGDIVAAFQTYLRPSIAFLAETFAPSFPSNNTLQDAQVVSAFLGQELERRLGTTKTLQGVCDASLEGTDPDTEALMSEEEIVAKVENVIPTTKQFFKGEVRTRLRHLSSKSDGGRRVNIYKKSGRYCLPFESRSVLLEHKIQDEALKAAVSEGFRMRILEASNAAYGSNVINTITNTLHRIIETVFERQGFGASCHFLSDADTMDSLLDNRSIVDIAEDHLKLSGLNINEHRGILNVTKTVIRGVFYQPSEPERTYCARLSRTYVILFIIRNTPEIINYFNTMSKHFFLYVGSDLIIRAISEYYLPQSDQMTVNAFKILWQAGSKLILTEAMLEEVHSHIYASHLEYNNYYLDIDFCVDEALASQCDRILIRAYYYSKFDQGNPDRPRTWTQYINNFLSSAKLFGATSTVSMRSLRDTLCRRFGFEYEARNEISSGVDTDELRTLTNQIIRTRRSTKPERLSENDALLILQIDSMRRSKENSSGNPYGYKTWYLTQDVISGVAASKCFPKRRGNKYVMRPEFILNYIAYNPTNAQVQESLHTIFPSVLGIRLGSRLDARTLENVLLKIREAYQVDSARASAIVAEHADALKSDRMRDFALKYGSGRGSSST